MYQINIPNINGELTAEMTKEQVMKFHDELTTFINDNWEELTEDYEVEEIPMFGGTRDDLNSLKI